MRRVHLGQCPGPLPMHLSIIHLSVKKRRKYQWRHNMTRDNLSFCLVLLCILLFVNHACSSSSGGGRWPWPIQVSQDLMMTIKNPRPWNLLPPLSFLLSTISEKITLCRFLFGNPKNTSLRYRQVLNTILSSLPRAECGVRRQGGTHLCPGCENLPADCEACCLEQYLSCWTRLL